MKGPDKYEKVAQLLDRKLRAGHWCMGERLPGERPLAADFGVSYLTMRRAIGELIGRGILERRHGSGTYVVGDSSIHNVGVILTPPSGDYAARPFIGLLLDQLRRRFHEHGLNLRSYLFFGDGNFRDEPCFPALAQDVRKGAVKALIVEPVIHKVELERIHRTLCPVVIMSASDYRLHAVFIDAETMVRDGVAALTSRGCRRILFLDPYAPDAASGTTGKRLLSRGATGFRQALREAGLPLAGPIIPLAEHCLDRAMETLRNTAFDGLLIGDDVWGKRLLDMLLLDGRMPGRNYVAAVLANRGFAVLKPYENRVIRLIIDPAEIASALLQMAMGAASLPPPKTYLRRAICASVVFPEPTAEIQLRTQVNAGT